MIRKSIIAQFRVKPGSKVRLAKFPTDWTGTPEAKKLGKETIKRRAREVLDANRDRLTKVQEVLYANDTYSLLLIFQALDAAGKDGTIRHVMSGVNPQGCQVFSFKGPSAEDLDHNFLWRYAKRTPERGRIGIFNRSYYEEVLVVRVHPEILERQKLPPGKRGKKFWEARYRDINTFEQHLSDNGTIILKFFLHLSKGEQKRRFLERLDNPEKHWKFSAAMSYVKIPLLGQNEAELVRFAQSIDQPAYRGRQLFEWLYKKRASTFEEMTSLSTGLRTLLSEKAAVQSMAVVNRQESVDGTKKFLFELQDGLRVESVLIRSELKQKNPEDPLDCAFCATASMGFLRNLKAGEIIGQVLSVASVTGIDISNIVFMGMGEPLMNYDEVMKSADILVDGAGFAPRRITVSTAGWVDRIRQMADEERKIKLAVSLHSAIEATRRKLMPVTKRHSVQEISDAIEYYVRRSGRNVMLEQTFFSGVNDTDEEVSALIRFSRRASCRINVIPFHSIVNTGPTGFSATLRPSPIVDTIVQRMRESKVPVFVRKSSGVDIDAACGQLTSDECGDSLTHDLGFGIVG